MLTYFFVIGDTQGSVTLSISSDSPSMSAVASSSLLSTSTSSATHCLSLQGWSVHYNPATTKPSFPWWWYNPFIIPHVHLEVCQKLLKSSSWRSFHSCCPKLFQSHEEHWELRFFHHFRPLLGLSLIAMRNMRLNFNWYRVFQVFIILYFEG